jgi:hypothetical protein
MNTEELTDKAIDYILHDLGIDVLARAKGRPHSRMTEWEMNFVESIIDQWARRKHLTDKQKEILGKIWDKV